MENLSLEDRPPPGPSAVPNNVPPPGPTQLPPQVRAWALRRLRGWSVDSPDVYYRCAITRSYRQSVCSRPLFIGFLLIWKAEKLLLVLRDGRKLIGVLRSWDQFGTSTNRLDQEI